MKTVVIAGVDNYTFSAADLLNPAELKLVGYATPIEEAWNIYNEAGQVIENIEEMPIMPLEAAVKFEPDEIILAAANKTDEERLKYDVFRTGYMGEVVSLFEHYHDFSVTTATIRKMAWRLDELGVEGSVADLGCGHGDVAWQMNALMPDRKLILFDTFTGYDARDVMKEQELQTSDVKQGEYAFTVREQLRIDELLLGRMPYEKNVEIRKGWFPDTALELEDEKYALVYMETDLYAPTFAGIQYFFPRLSRGGVIVLKGYEDGKRRSVRKAVEDLEQQYGAFLITPLCDPDGTVVITCP